MKPRFSHRLETGSGLTELLIVAGLGIAVLAAINSGLSGLTGTSRKLESSMDLSSRVGKSKRF